MSIHFNNVDSFRDMELIRLDVDNHKTPNVKKIKSTVPFMNGSYDFSNIYGSKCYDERVLEYEFFLGLKERSYTEQQLEILKVRVENWLMGTNEKTKLIDNKIVGFHYIAECTNINFETLTKYGKFKATFEAYPFKICDSYEGNNIWDTFNFELDMLQETKFTVTGSKEVSIHNLSATNITPEIICSNDIKVIKNGVTYSLKTGTSKDYRLFLETGENKLTAKGNGTIEFRFRKELL